MSCHKDGSWKLKIEFAKAVVPELLKNLLQNGQIPTAMMQNLVESFARIVKVFITAKRKKIWNEIFNKAHMGLMV